jgi:polyhydroxyalkanoate synthesis regulator phasin
MYTVSDIRRFMEGAVGKLTPAKAQELAKSIRSGQGKEQVTKTAQELLEWSNRNRQRISDLVRGEVRSQMKTMGVASQAEVDALKKRVRELERAQSGSRKRSPAKKRTTTRKRTTAKPTTTEPPAETPTADTPPPAPAGEGA